MKKKKDFFQELRDRNVWREIKAYLFGGAAMIPLIWLVVGLLNYVAQCGNMDKSADELKIFG